MIGQIWPFRLKTKILYKTQKKIMQWCVFVSFNSFTYFCKCWSLSMVSYTTTLNQVISQFRYTFWDWWSFTFFRVSQIKSWYFPFISRFFGQIQFDLVTIQGPWKDTSSKREFDPFWEALLLLRVYFGPTHYFSNSSLHGRCHGRGRNS